MATSLERQIEDNVISIITGSVTGINIYNGERWGDKDYYAEGAVTGTIGILVVAAKSLGKELYPASGVFPVSLDLEFGSKFYDQSVSDIETKWTAIRQQLYFDTTLQSRLSSTGFTCYGATQENEDLEVDDDQKLWKKRLTLKLWATPTA